MLQHPLKRECNTTLDATITGVQFEARNPNGDNCLYTVAGPLKALVKILNINNNKQNLNSFAFI